MTFAIMSTVEFRDELLRFQSSAVGLIDPNSKLDWKVIFKPKNSSEEMPYTTVGELDAVTKDHNFECLLDDSQLDALKLACSQPLTIIQVGRMCHCLETVPCQYICIVCI